MKIKYTCINKNYKTWKVGDKVKLAHKVHEIDAHLVGELDKNKVYTILGIWSWNDSRAIKVLSNNRSSNFAVESFIKVN